MPSVIQSPIYKTAATFGGTIHRIDTIEYEQKLWLVPNWLNTQDGKWKMPTRLIHPQEQEFQPFGDGRFVLSHPLPKELFESRPLKLPIAGYMVEELPEIALVR